MIPYPWILKFKEKNVQFVSDWVTKEGRHKLCSVFDGRNRIDLKM